MIGVAAAFSHHGRIVSPDPMWIQAIDLEWLHWPMLEPPPDGAALFSDNNLYTNILIILSYVSTWVLYFAEDYGLSVDMGKKI